MKPILLSIVLLYVPGAKPQTESKDTLNVDDNVYEFLEKKLIVPSAMISYDVLSLMSDDLKSLNRSTRYETQEHIVAGTIIDNYIDFSKLLT